MQKIHLLLLLLAGWLAPALAAAQLYDVRPGEVNYNKKSRPALKVQVDGKATDVREFLQDWMKSSYNVKFKTGGLLGMGKSDVLMAKQTPASTVSCFSAASTITPSSTPAAPKPSTKPCAP
jgi:hypothetical protein